MRQYQLFIDGEFIARTAGKMIPVLNPATEEVISEVPAGSGSDVEAAVAAAERAQRPWAKRPAIERAGYLRELANAVRAAQEMLARTISEEQGKVLPLARQEVLSAATYLDYTAECARRVEGEIIESDRPNETIFLFKQPIGVIAGILPWNFPFFMIVRKLAPALLTGNAIVMPDADLDLAARCIRASRIRNTGQVCNCAERVYVHEAVADAFLGKITVAMERTRFGDPLAESDLDMGPLVSMKQLEQVDAAVQQAVKDGATLVLGGHRTDRKVGSYYPATVLTHCDHKSAIMQKEVFGPVLPITTFRDLDEAIELANDCEYGLTSSIYTQNLDVAMRACKEIKFGETYINRENGETRQGFHAGWRKSGIGGADGKHGLEEYLQSHVVYVQYNHEKR